MEIILPAENFNSDYSAELEEYKEEIVAQHFHYLPAWKFIMLFVVTFGIYQIYWFYKGWDFIKDYDERDIKPIWRSIFSILFAHSLFDDTLAKAKSQGYQKSYSSGWLFIGFLILSLTSRLPDPLWLIALLGFLPLLPVLHARNYYFKTAHPEGRANAVFSGGEIVITVLGVILWVLVVIGLFATETVTY